MREYTCVRVCELDVKNVGKRPAIWIGNGKYIRFKQNINMSLHSATVILITYISKTLIFVCRAALVRVYCPPPAPPICAALPLCMYECISMYVHNKYICMQC